MNEGMLFVFGFLEVGGFITALIFGILTLISFLVLICDTKSVDYSVVATIIIITSLSAGISAGATNVLNSIKLSGNKSIQPLITNVVSTVNTSATILEKK